MNRPKTVSIYFNLRNKMGNSDDISTSTSNLNKQVLYKQFQHYGCDIFSQILKDKFSENVFIINILRHLILFY